MANKEERLEIVETLRGVAALTVLIYHWTICVPGFIRDSLTLEICKRLNIGVYIFFAISGFIMPYALQRGCYRLGDIGRFVVKRIIRLDPPFLVSIVFYLLTAYLATLNVRYAGVPFRLDPLNIALHLGYLCPFFGQPWVQGGIYWTLGIEFQFYLLLSLIFPILAASRRWMAFAVLILFTSLCRFDGAAYRFHFLTPYAPFFAMGIVTFLYRMKRFGTVGFLALLGLLAILASLKFEIHQMAGAVLTSMLIGLYQRPKAPLLFFGRISYSLYLFHFAIALKTVNYLMRYPWAVRYNWLIVILGSAFCVGVAWICYRLIERPSKLLASRIHYCGNSRETDKAAREVFSPSVTQLQ